MKALFAGAAVALLLAGGLSASAQTTVIETRPGLELSPTQRTTIYRTVRRQPVVVPAPDVNVRVGAPIPRSVELRPIPEDVYVDVPVLRRYRYMVVNDEVVLVDPETSQVVEIIRE
jgi:hypothetical protein